MYHPGLSISWTALDAPCSFFTEFGHTSINVLGGLIVSLFRTTYYPLRAIFKKLTPLERTNFEITLFKGTLRVIAEINPFFIILMEISLKLCMLSGGEGDIIPGSKVYGGRRVQILYFYHGSLHWEGIC
jgi:hypothetical protein